MINKANAKNVIVVIVVLVALLLVVFAGDKRGDNKGISMNPGSEDQDENKNIIQLCFADIKIAGDPKNAMEDEYTLRMKLDGEKVTGELNFLPRDKDKKTGKFEGTVSPVDRQIMARTIDAIWDTFAEGTNVKEELRIVFGEGTASVGAGEMRDRGDGVYVYRDKSKLSYAFSLTDVDCQMLDEREIVKEYLKKNIPTLAPIKASLGGTWFVLRTIVNTSLNTGFVVYEDGHNEERRPFTYEIDQDGQIISLKII